VIPYLSLMFASSLRVVLFGSAWLLFGCATLRRTHPAPKMTTVYIVRHAEKANADRDTPLSEVGLARAEALALRLGDVGVDLVYATSLQRTQQTVGPLAARVGTTIRIVEPMAIDSLVGLIRAEGCGHVVLVAGHNHTVPRIVETLSGQPAAAIPEQVYDRLYRVDLPVQGMATVTLLHYGEPTP